MRRVTRVLAGAASAAALAGTLSGCGIRATAVPVDAGAAPSRAACALPSTPAQGSRMPRTRVRIYLVCGERLFPVKRPVPLVPGDRAALAQVLLTQLTTSPGAAEERSGFASEVPGGLSVLPPVRTDPADTWRLTAPPDSLPGYAVGQLVCTFADATPGGTGHPVVLGGPDITIAARRYTCDDALRTNPDAGPTAGTPVG